LPVIVVIDVSNLTLAPIRATEVRGKVVIILLTLVPHPLVL